MADAVAANAAVATATPAQSQPAQTPVGEAALARLPEKLQNLTRPVVVTGTVAGETPEGLTRVRTAAGEVLLKAPVALPADKPVTLQIPAGSPPAKAMVSAQLPSPPTAAPAASPPPQVNTPQVNTQVNTAPLQSAVTTLLQQTASAAAIGPAQLPSVGALISAVVIAVNPRPTGTAAPAGGGASPVQTAPTGGGKSEASAGKAAAEDEGTSAADGAASKATGAIRGGGASTHGQSVELGGDAAHRGTMLGPPPGAPPRKPDEQADPQRQQQQQQQTPTDNRKTGEPNTGTGKADSPHPGKPGAPPPASPPPPGGTAFPSAASNATPADRRPGRAPSRLITARPNTATGAATIAATADARLPRRADRGPPGPAAPRPGGANDRAGYACRTYVFPDLSTSDAPGARPNIGATTGARAAPASGTNPGFPGSRRRAAACPRRPRCAAANIAAATPAGH